MNASDKSEKMATRRRILVIDDDPELRETIRALLESDYDVSEAESVAQSLAIFDQEKPDLITLDVYMPEVSGMEGLEIFRQRSNRIPIVLISGHHTFELAQQALRLGANDYLTKPFTAEALHQTIQSALEKAYEDTAEPTSARAKASHTMRLPLQNLTGDKFLSVQHRNSFLAFAQNVLSDKKPAYEEMFIRELAKTIDLQVQSLRLREKIVCDIPPINQTTRIKCDMYLLGGALANLALTCTMGTRTDRSPLKVLLADTGKEFRVTYKKKSMELPEEMLTRFEYWRQHQHTNLTSDVAMLALAEKVVLLHGGQVSTPSGSLMEIALPIHAA